MLPADSPFASPPAPGPHPATAELRAYAAGTLPPADEHRIEAHALNCERCSELLEGFSMSDVPTTDQALAGLRARLQARVADDLVAPALPASRPLWPRLAAAAALLGVAAGGIWGWEQYEPAPEAAVARVETTAPAAATTAPPAAPAEVAAPPAVASATEPPVASAPPATILARRKDYAAAAPARRRARLRVGPAAPPRAAAPEQAVVTAATVPAATEPRHEPALPSVAAAPHSPSASKELARLAPDTVRALSEVAVAVQAAKTRTAQASPAALVANTPMPAVAAIAPAPITGTPALRDYLRRAAAEFELEEGAKPMNGTVRLRFTVGADGQLSNLRVVRSMRADYDEEALRMICEGPAWRPGIAGGRRAALPVEVTVSF